MVLCLHHMHPLGTVLDRVAHLLRPGGVLILDEFADWADEAPRPDWLAARRCG